MAYMCEQQGCDNLATTLWVARNEDEWEVYETYRCNRHPEDSPEYVPEPLILRPGKAELFYESLQQLRKNEQLCLLQYERVYACSGCGEPIMDNKRLFTAPNGKRYHNRDCASIDEQLLNKEE